ncbi:trans-aconitate 2-methyltransferase [Ramlibacter humi]|uniref:Trans-aconitate 2-methyltransferase n=1 Tax=Ramlibacter humi TaxID=2530451 RepID=A0A4Z0C0Q5_9BURK|nr:trans-aconitate 2-methyltransferase [Ramlibacter humi]TFZ04100.1 trans-aconitate 2-methyltransferase [Ramlibacter humi]
MSDWNPALYGRYEDERTRPARELLARVPLEQAARVADLGCGPGNSTELLLNRFGGAQVVGIDNSPAMLDSARQRLPGTPFELADIGTWSPAEPFGLLYSNATLQWVRGHETLFPRLYSLLAPGGVLAVQMPDNLGEPSHRAMREVAALPSYTAHIGDPEALRAPVLSVGQYYDLLAAQGAKVDVWHTVYQHPLASAAAIVEWVRATGLRPFVDRLPAALQVGYLAEYEKRIDERYPARADGQRLLAFPRLFIVARKPA